MKNTFIILIIGLINISCTLVYGQFQDENKKVNSQMKSTIQLLFKRSIETGNENYSEDQINSNWIGNPPATISEIKRAEERLQIELPEDYIELLLITNGFLTSNSAVEPSFVKLDQIDYYRNYKDNVIDVWKESEELQPVVKELEKAIIIAGLEDETKFLLIPPGKSNENWKYWKFANWIPGEHEFGNLNDYLKWVIDSLEEEIKNK